MKHSEFNKLLDRRLNLIGEILASKSKEYARDGDKLYNFKRAATIQGTTPAQALIGMWSKHLVSVLDMAEADIEARPDAAIIDEKIGDAINYLILLEAILKEHT